MRLSQLIPIGILASLQVPVALHVQARPDQPAPRFRTEITFVELDVTVVDREGRPIPDLSAAEFAVIEDDVTQKIEKFSVITLPETPSSGRWWRSVAGDVRTNTGAANGRLIALVIDDAHIEPLRTTRTKEIARHAVQRLSPNDRMAIIYTWMNGRSQDFTDDVGLLNAAIDRFQAGRSQPRPALAGAPPLAPEPTTRVMEADDRNLGYWPRQALDTLENVAKYVAALSGWRKTLIYVSEAFGVHPTNPDLLDILREAPRSNLNIYAMSPLGLASPYDVISPLENDAKRGYQELRDRREMLQTIAENTGGFAIVDTNDLEQGIERVFADASCYYHLGYYSSSQRESDKLRRIEVRVGRPGVIARSRKAYLPAQPQRTKPEGSNGSLASATASLLPASGLPLELTVSPFRSARNQSLLAATLRVRPPLRETSGDFVDQIDVHSKALDEHGQVKLTEQHKFGLRLKPRESAAGNPEYQLHFPLTLRPGRYQLRLAASSRAASATGSVYYDLIVPACGARRAYGVIFINATDSAGAAEHPAAVRMG
jgi:VWFA-related protein